MVDPPTALSTYRAAKRHRPSTGSRALPSTHSAHILKARCQSEAWRKAVVTKRHGCRRYEGEPVFERLMGQLDQVDGHAGDHEDLGDQRVGDRASTE